MVLPKTEEVLTHLASHPGALLMPPPEQGNEQDGKEGEAAEPTTAWVSPTVTVPTPLCQYFQEPMTARQFYQVVYPDLETSGLGG